MLKFISHIVSVILLASAPSVVCFAQQQTSDINSPFSKGKLEVIEDPKIKELVSRHIAINDSLKTMPGYRIQLFFGSGVNSKTQAKDVQADFIRKYPDVESYLIWDTPNYKVRVGDFRTRLDALKFHHSLGKDFPESFIVKDDISLPVME